MAAAANRINPSVAARPHPTPLVLDICAHAAIAVRHGAVLAELRGIAGITGCVR
jgi:hypothetical protein